MEIAPFPHVPLRVNNRHQRPVAVGRQSPPWNRRRFSHLEASVGPPLACVHYSRSSSATAVYLKLFAPCMTAVLRRVTVLLLTCPTACCGRIV